MAIKLQNTADLAKADAIKVLIYGDSGAGKTRLISTAPSPIILSAESGLMSLRAYQLPYIVIKTYKDLEEAFLWASKSIEMRQFHTIALDSISEIAEVLLADLKTKHKDPRKAYFEIQETCTALFRGFRDIPQKHVYFSAKQDRIKDEISGAMSYGPSLPGSKLAQAVPYLFDEVFQLTVFSDPATQVKTRALRTCSDPQYIAKDRSGSLDVWEPADLGHVFNKIQKG